MGAMAHGAGRHTGIGVFSQAVLEVKGTLCEKPIRAALDQILGRIPLLHGQMARDWQNLAPYWKVSPSARDSPIPLRVVDLPALEAGRADQLFVDHGNAPFDADWQHCAIPPGANRPGTIPAGGGV